MSNNVVYVGNVPERMNEDGESPPYMPLSTRHRLGAEINQAWREFTEEMHDGPLTGAAVADKFWRYLTR